MGLIALRPNFGSAIGAIGRCRKILNRDVARYAWLRSPASI
jgi:hypothetical protein